MQYPLIGKKVVFIGNERFDPELVADEAATITITPSTTEINSQDGTINVPNGAFDEISASITLIFPDIATMARVWPGLAKKAENAAIGTQIRFGAAECVTSEAVPVVIHNYCDTTSENDIRIPGGIVQAGGEFSVTIGDPFSVEVNITPTKTDEGYVVFGPGRLDVLSAYNPETATYEEVYAATESITANPANVSVQAGKSTNVALTITPDNAAPATATSADETKVKVTVSGKTLNVSGVAATVANKPVTVTAKSGDKSVNIPVTVTAAAGA